MTTYETDICSAWLAYKRQAIILIEMILHRLARSRIVEAMMMHESRESFCPAIHADQMDICEMCGASVPESEMTRIGGVWICLVCKTKYEKEIRHIEEITK